VAHRGYWDCAGSAQNSITSLKLADKIGCYGSEFDVHLTKDGVIVVHHDQNVGKIDIQTSTYKALKKERLKNGEKIPTLEQYLDAGKDLSCKLVLEIKRQMVQSHEDSLVRQCVDMVKSKGLTDRIVWISFSGKACELLHQLLPDAHIQYLLGDWDPKTIKAKGLSGIDYEQKVLALHPEWIKECHDLGLVVNVWTVNDLNTINQFIKAGVDFITTNAPVEGLKLAK
ncbi:MAG: glycerophosphodiester phosphodiesterase, partial [Prevotella sp.]|nr:glycerophosphodiester phosphodiesterase [Prevotella sp.]